MAAYLRLRSKSDPTKAYSGEDLLVIDEMICAHLGVPVDPKKWCYRWMDIIGFAMAVGLSDETIIQDCEADVKDHPDSETFQKTLAIAKYLIENFTNDSYHGR